MNTYLIEPLTSLVFRPARDKFLPWKEDSIKGASPRVIAGMFRNSLFQENNGNNDWETAQIIGPLLAVKKPEGGYQILIEQPSIAFVVRDEKGNYIAYKASISTLPEGSGTNAPNGLSLYQINDDISSKPSSEYPYWSLEFAIEWIKNGNPKTELIPGRDIFKGPSLEVRTHNRIDKKTKSVDGSGLFRTTRFNFQFKDENGYQEYVYLFQSPSKTKSTSFSAKLGGEGGLVKVSQINGEYFEKLNQNEFVPNENERVHLLAITPSIFSKNGYIPDTVNTGEGDLICKKTKLNLIGVSNHKWYPISGWISSGNQPKYLKHLKQGARPMEKAVPGGSIYTFLPTKEAQNIKGLINLSTSETQNSIDGFCRFLPISIKE